MQTASVIVIGAGQAGLAISHCLSDRAVDHVVLERGRVAERWRGERWDSLRLLTPNWMSRLPGWSYRGSDPDGFMTAGEVADYLGDYARASRAPIQPGTTVRSVRRSAYDSYRVETDRGTWRASAVVLATGHCDIPLVPAAAQSLPASIQQLTPSTYRNPAQLPADAGVLVVGAAATGVQLAHEIHRSGRPVFLSVGRHTRLPRSYRGRDIWWWLERSGVLDETAEAVRDVQRARSQPSFQLVGRPDGRTLHLGALQRMGVRMLGRLGGADGTHLHLHDDLAETTGAAQAALERLLRRLDAIADLDGAPAGVGAAPAFDLGRSPTTLDLQAAGIRTVIWATGFRRDYRWLQVPGVLDVAGELRHRGGVTPAPGLYALGLRFQRRRRSNFLDGVGGDAEALAGEILGHLVQRLVTRAAA